MTYCILNYFVFYQLNSIPKVDIVHLASYLYFTIKVKNCAPTSIMVPSAFHDIRKLKENIRVWGEHMNYPTRVITIKRKGRRWSV